MQQSHLRGVLSSSTTVASVTPIVPAQRAPFASTRPDATLSTRWIEAKPMAEDRQSTSGVVPGLVEEFIAQLRGITEGVEGLAGFGAPPVGARRVSAARCSVGGAADVDRRQRRRAATEHRGAESPAVLVRRAACGAGADPRPARSVEQHAGVAARPRMVPSAAGDVSWDAGQSWAVHSMVSSRPGWGWSCSDFPRAPVWTQRTA